MKRAEPTGEGPTPHRHQAWVGWSYLPNSFKNLEDDVSCLYHMLELAISTQTYPDCSWCLEIAIETTTPTPWKAEYPVREESPEGWPGLLNAFSLTLGVKGSLTDEWTQKKKHVHSWAPYSRLKNKDTLSSFHLPCCEVMRSSQRTHGDSLVF